MFPQVSDFFPVSNVPQRTGTLLFILRYFLPGVLFFSISSPLSPMHTLVFLWFPCRLNFFREGPPFFWDVFFASIVLLSPSPPG